MLPTLDLSLRFIVWEVTLEGTSPADLFVRGSMQLAHQLIGSCSLSIYRHFQNGSH